MIKISVLYPNQLGTRFDLDYYIDKHLPLIKKLLGSACYDITLDKGISGLPGEPPVYSIICNIFSESMDVFLKAFGDHVLELEADVSNFTEIKSIVQISEVLVAGKQSN